MYPSPPQKKKEHPGNFDVCNKKQQFSFIGFDAETRPDKVKKKKIGYRNRWKYINMCSKSCMRCEELKRRKRQMTQTFGNIDYALGLEESILSK